MYIRMRVRTWVTLFVSVGQVRINSAPFGEPVVYYAMLFSMEEEDSNSLAGLVTEEVNQCI
jgi:hypothetical protein